MHSCLGCAQTTCQLLSAICIGPFAVFHSFTVLIPKRNIFNRDYDKVPADGSKGSCSAESLSTVRAPRSREGVPSD